MPPRPRVLTFNFHEPYLCLMAKTGLRLFVGQYRNPPLARAWQTHYRPIPPNVVLLDEPEWRRDLMAGKFDVVVAHNETNALNVFRSPASKLLVCHNRRTFLNSTASKTIQDIEQKFGALLERLQEQFAFVFISESKRDDYGVPGRVILPGIDVEEYGGYTGVRPEIIRVGNMMRERNLMFDVDFQEEVCRGLPNRVLGDNPGIPGSASARSFEDLLDHYRSARCILHVSRQEWEDGYNLSLLEALACGTPALSLANRTSPLTDGEDGFVSFSADILRGRAEELLNDLDWARAIGTRGRETVARKFPMQAFVDLWIEAIETAAEVNPWRRTRPANRPRHNILMHYLCSPMTTGRYFHIAAKKRHGVVAAGFRCPEEVLALWGFTGDPPPYPPHAIDLPLEGTCRQIRDAIPKGFQPDLYLWIDSGLKKVPPDLDVLSFPKAGYLIDTHIAPELRLEMARHFDYTFLAQKGQLQLFRDAGIRNVSWIPLACSPELHDVGPQERIHDVSFICNTEGDHIDRRKRIVESLTKRYPNSRTGRFWPQEMALIYAQSKIVVNACINRDVNMRVFEALASGALLITDEAVGLEDLFEDGKHLVVYRNDAELFGLIDRYLADDAARERIAEAGRALVYERHTYEHRLAEMLRVIFEATPSSEERPNADARFAPGGYYRNTREDLIQHVPRSTRRVLDIGCSGGDFGRRLKELGVQEVAGVELDSHACALAKTALDRVVEGNIETVELPFEDGHFDCIVFGDVLEHLVDPAAVIRKVSRFLAPEGVILMCIPNVRFYEVVQMLINGRWRYEDAGILDRTHLRFFTAADIHLMVEDAGLELLHLGTQSFIPPERLPLNPDRTLSLVNAVIGPLTDEDYREFRTYQYLAVAGKPGIDRLASARQALHEERYDNAMAVASGAYGVDEAERRVVIGSALARIGQVGEAEKIYKEALDMRPGDREVLGKLGILYVAMNRLAEARPCLESAVEQGGNDRAQGALGLLHLSEGRPEEAFTQFRKALESGYDNHALLPHFIATARHLGRLPEVVDTVRRFADFYPGNLDLAYACAQVLAELGMNAEAQSRLESILLFNPQHEPAQKLLNTLIGNAG
ncbi:MAG: hypothetical protein QG656_2032 [Candidatus Hydrogenedentes bacterium]|nr:hypothetical protein [Candidatus Hydrogenedentota bacterium]